MTVTFAQKLAAIPGYSAGVPAGKAPEAIAGLRHRPARLERVAVGAAPGGRRGDRARRRGGEPLPGPGGDPAAAADRRAPRGRLGPGRRLQRLLRDPARRGAGAVRAGRRARLRMAVVLDLPLPGAALGRARDPRPARRRRRARPRRDARRGHRGDPAADRLQPEQPDRDPPAGGADRRALRARARPRHRDRRRGLRRVSAPRRSRRDRRPAPRLPQPGPAAHLLQGLRARRPAGRLRALLAGLPRRRRRGAPAVQRQRAGAGGGRGGDPPLRRRLQAGRAHDRRAGHGRRRACASSASRRRTRTRTSPGSRWATATRPRSSPRSPSRGSSSAPARRSAAPATSASPTARRSRTGASSTRSSARCSSGSALAPLRRERRVDGEVVIAVLGPARPRAARPRGHPEPLADRAAASVADRGPDLDPVQVPFGEGVTDQRRHRPRRQAAPLRRLGEPVADRRPPVHPVDAVVAEDAGQGAVDDERGLKAVVGLELRRRACG